MQPADLLLGSRHGTEHFDAAVELLETLYREQGNPFLFIGRQGQRLSPASMSTLLHWLGRTETVHGFRASFKTWSEEQTSHPNLVIEMSLAHSVGTDVEQAYRRTTLFNKRRVLMPAWARFVTAAPGKKAAADNVVSIGGGR